MLNPMPHTSRAKYTPFPSEPRPVSGHPYDQSVLVRATIQQIPPDNARTYDLETRDVVVEDAGSYEEGKARIAPQVPEGWRVIGYSTW